MSLIFYNQDLLELLEQFYVLTGIRIVLFDADGSESAACPSGGRGLCGYMRKNELFRNRCSECDAENFKKCRKTQKLTVYKCHAGFIEAVSPLTEGGRLIGYVMFGQIADSGEKADFAQRITALCREYGESDVDKYVKKIKYKSPKHVLAASKILDAITSYILMKEMVRPRGKQLIDEIEKFVDAHLSEDLSVERLCSEFAVSRSRLYDYVGQSISGGIASFVKQKRLLAAKKLVEQTDLPLAEIAYKTGFADYGYFLRVFKRQFGISPGNVRKTLK